MSLSKQALAAQLTAALHLGPGAGGRPPKAVAKTLRHLAKQLRKATRRATQPTAKQVRKALAEQLTAVLVPFLHLEIPAGGAIAKAVDNTVKRLAKQLVKLRRRQDKALARRARQPAPGPAALAPLPAAAAQPAAPRPAARRPAPKVVPVRRIALNANGVASPAGLGT